jgi:hypothetical protein
MDEGCASIKRDGMRKAWRNDPDHVTVQLSLNRPTRRILPFRANVSWIESDRQLRTVVAMFTPGRPGLVSRINAVSTPLLPDVVRWGSGGKTSQEMFGGVHRATDDTIEMIRPQTFRVKQLTNLLYRMPLDCYSAQLSYETLSNIGHGQDGFLQVAVSEAPAQKCCHYQQPKVGGPNTALRLGPMQEPAIGSVHERARSSASSDPTSRLLEDGVH